ESSSSEDEDENVWQTLLEIAPDLRLPVGLNPTKNLSKTESEQELGHFFLNKIGSELGRERSIRLYAILLQRLLNAYEASGQEFSDVEEAAALLRKFEAGELNEDEDDNVWRTLLEIAPDLELPEGLTPTEGLSKTESEQEQGHFFLN